MHTYPKVSTIKSKIGVSNARVNIRAPGGLFSQQSREAEQSSMVSLHAYHICESLANSTISELKHDVDNVFLRAQ